MKHPNKLDWFIYNLFRWWWTPIFTERPDILRGLRDWTIGYLKERNLD